MTVAWPEYDGTALAIKERRVDAAGASGPVVTVSDPLARPENTNAVNTVEVRGHGDGTASIAWSEQPNANVTSLKVRRVGPTGALGSVREITRGSSLAIVPPRIAAHPDGSVTAAWGEASSLAAAIYVTRISASGAIGAPEHICELALHRSRAGMQCLDLAGGPDHAYDVASNGDGSATVVARRPQHEDIASWRVDDLGQASSPTILETVVPDFSSRRPQVITGADGSTVALWTGKLPSSDLPALHAAHIGRDNAVIGDQTLFPLADGRGRDPAQVLAGPAVTGSGAGIPIWSVWTDWTAEPTQDPMTTRQVYAARYPVTLPPPPPPIAPRPTRMVAFGDSYSSGEGLTAEPGLRYDCGTDMHQGMYRQDTTVLADRSWSSLDCDTRTLTGTQPSDLYQRPLRKHENLCHRHARAYPNQIRSALNIDPVDYMFVACSGAETKHVGLVDDSEARFPSSPVNVHGGKTQIQTVDPGFTQNGSPDLATIGIGGNDAAFAQIIEQCFRGDCLDSEFRQGTIAKINGSTFDRLVETFKGLTDRLPDATVLAFGYPEVVGDPDKPCGRVNALQLNVGSWNISHDELEWITSEVEPALNRAIRDAAAQAGVVYVDIEAATRGHELCSDTDDRWINGLVGGDDRKIDSGEWIGNESFHPNQKAHDAISRYFIAHYTDGAGRLSVHNPDPSTPPRPAPGPEIYLGSLEAGAVRPCGEDCRQPTRCVPGCSIRLEGRGFAPGSQLTVTLHSEPAVLGTIQVDDEGHLAGDLATPTDTPPGIHLIKLTGRSSDGRSQYGGAFIEVFEAATPPLGSLPILPALPKGPQDTPSGPISSLTLRISSPVSARWRRKGRATRVASMVVRRIPRAATVTVECKRPKRTSRPTGCPFGVKRFKMKRARKRLSLAKLFGRPLRARTRVTISITQPGWIGKRVVFAVRRTGKPRTTRYCLPLGSSVARREC